MSKKHEAIAPGSDPRRRDSKSAASVAAIKPKGSKTRGLSIREAVERDILSGRLPPGTKLEEETLAARYGASRTPVREALRQLASQGHIELRPHMGAYVSQLSISELGQMFETMAVLESACAELAALRHTAEDRQLLSDAHAACLRAARKKCPDSFFTANARFHERIYAASHNDYLCSNTVQLGNRLEAYRRVITFHVGLMALTIKEHEGILQAIFDMDSVSAASRMRGHFDTLRDDAVSMATAVKLANVKKAA
jgi:DNA-binding GntR family transcriptional regulator